MKIPKQTITVTLSDPEGIEDAILVFDMPKENERQRFLAALSEIGKLIEEAKKNPEATDSRVDGVHLQATITEHSKSILKGCLSVRGLVEADHVVTVEDVRESRLYGSTVEMLVSGFNAARQAIGGVEVSEKNASSPAVPANASDSASSSGLE